MPRYFSSYRQFTITALHPDYQPVMKNGHLVEMETSKGVQCEFSHKHLTQWEWEIASKKLSLRGLGLDEDPRLRFSVYDTDSEAITNNWSAETKAAVEAQLDKNLGPDLCVIEKPKLDPPWPNYDKIVPQRGRTKEQVAEIIANHVRDEGEDARYIILYEQENFNRPEVIQAVEVAEAEQGVLEGEEITA